MVTTSTLTVKEAAAEYIRRNWSPVPIPYRTKYPVIEGWPQLRITAETIGQHFNGARQNIGIILGEASGQLVDIDLDHPTAVKLAHTYLPPTQSIFGRPGKPRSHWLYRITAPREYDSWDSKRLKELTGVASESILEFRSTGGLQTVFPPSIHEKGEPITWDIDGEPALVDPAELHECCALLAAAVLRHHGIDPDEPEPKPEPEPRTDYEKVDGAPEGVTPWDDYNKRGDFRQVLHRHGWRKTRDAVPGDDNERWRRPGKEEGHSGTINADRVFYCWTNSASPFQNKKGYSPFQVYMLLEHSGDPKAAGRALAELGYGKQDTSVDTSKILRQGDTPPPPPNEPEPIQPLTIRQLIERYPRMRAPNIHGLLREGETANIISAPKVGKSWLVSDLALCKATARRWLGLFDVEPGPVLIIDNELVPARK